MKKQKGFTLIELMIVIMIVGILVMLAVSIGSGGRGHGCIFGCYPGYSEGERVGYVTKFSIKGVYFKTYEGELQVGQGAQAALQPPFAFSVPKENQDAINAISDAMKHGTKVTLKYSQWWMMPYRIGDSGYEIVEVIPVEAKPQEKLEE